MVKMDNKAVSSAYIRDNFEDAIRKGHIHAFFQPVYRTITGRICNVEALARWIDPVYGPITPMALIYELEKANLIYDLDMEILAQACDFYNELKDRGTPIHSFSVNLSRQDFTQADLFDRITTILNERNVLPEAINLEITESDMLNDPQTFHRLFEQFTKAGFSFWIDDFGSGYSSLNMLKNYSFDVLKFDLQFLQDFSLKNRQILSPMVNMAKNLGIHTLAEGVETMEQEKFLKSIGCEALQGFMFARPLSKEDFLSYLETNPGIIEPEAEKEYWNKAGFLDFQSPSPLDSFNGGITTQKDEDHKVFEELPLALLEVGQNKATYAYVSDAFMQMIKELDYPSVENLEHAFNDKISNQYLVLKKLIMNAVGSDEVQELDNVKNGIYYTVRARCIARMPEKALVALQLRIFETEGRAQPKYEMARYANALFTTYELVSVISIENDSSKRIFSSMGIQSYANSGDLRSSINRFCQNEVMAEDRGRYLAFFDLDTLDERIKVAGFIEDRFRMASSNDWKSIRISRIPSDTEVSYLYTISAVSQAEADRMNKYSIDHPEWRSN